MRNNVQYFLFGMRMMDQAILPKVFNSKEPYPEPDVAYLHDRKAERLMKLSDLQESEGWAHEKIKTSPSGYPNYRNTRRMWTNDKL